MIYIKKRAPPESFIQWQAQGSDEWVPSYANLQHPEKTQLHQALMEEQGGVCCYCGCRITAKNSHIEHFRPQKLYSGLALKYANLHTSCIREQKPTMPIHCGHAKGDAFDETLALSPLDNDCEQAFGYTLDGQIIPKNNKASYMLDLLKLNIGYLRTRRAEVLAGVFDNGFLENATDDELARLSQNFREFDVNSGQRPNFGHVVARYAEQLILKTNKT